MTPRSLSGQQSRIIEWHAHFAARPRLDAWADITSSVMMSINRCRSWELNTSISIEGVFEPANLQQPPDIARLAHRRSQPDLGDPRGRLGAVQQRAAEREHVRAIMFAGIPGHCFVQTHRRAHATNLVRSNRRTDSGTI